MTGPLGCFVVWRRMAYFGDALAHSALLGVALGVALRLHMVIPVSLVCISSAFCLLALRRRSPLTSDTLLGIIAHGFLALGLVVISVQSGEHIDVHHLLVGDLMALGPRQCLVLALLAALVLAALYGRWHSLLAICVDESLAAASGVPLARVRALMMVMLSLTIAAAMQTAGVLLATALLIIPAAAARGAAKTPEQMALYAAIIAMLAIPTGIAASHLGLPPGPTMVLFCTLIFIILTPLRTP